MAATYTEDWHVLFLLSGTAKPGRVAPAEGAATRTPQYPFWHVFFLVSGTAGPDRVTPAEGAATRTP